MYRTGEDGVEEGDSRTEQWVRVIALGFCVEIETGCRAVHTVS